MKFSIFVLAATSGLVFGYPGMGNLMAELAKRQVIEGAPEPQLIGDLLVRGATTDVGRSVKNCLLGEASCQSLPSKEVKRYVPPVLGTPACAADTCCVWSYISKDLFALFVNPDLTCNALARAAVRMGFHDAGAWSTTSGPGGADGSLVLSPDEINRPENNGMQNIRSTAQTILKTNSSFSVGAADLVQFMHNTATVVCPLGPQILTYVGRPDRDTADPPNLLPNTDSSAEDLIQLFADKTIGFKDLIALIGAHTTATQQFVDPSKAGQPLDSTPGVWDVKFYSECLAGPPPAGVFRLPSDDALEADATTNPGFEAFADPTSGQATWNADYATAYVRLSLLGVNNINNLTDCTKVLPSPILSFP